MEIYCTICCKNKSKDVKPLKAIDRYISDRIRSVSEKGKKDNIPFFILSGKIGLIKEDAKVPYYDLRLEDDRVEEMIKKVVIQMRHYAVSKINFFGVVPEKNPGWVPYYKVLQAACDELGVEFVMQKLK